MMKQKQNYLFLKKRHVAYMRRCLSFLPPHTVAYDTSRMTVLFFALSGLDVLEALESVPQQELEDIVQWIYSLQLTTADGHKCGGFRGGHCTTNITNHSCLNVTSHGRPGSCLEPTPSVSNHSNNVQIPSPTMNSNSESNTKANNDTGLDFRIENSSIPPKLQRLTSSGDKAPCSMDCGHIAMTYTALASLLLLGDDLSRVDKPAVLRHVGALQCADGSFQCNTGGSENDLRFVYCAAAVCHMLGDMSALDTAAATRYIVACLGYAGALGQGELQESHGGSTYCGVAALHLMGSLGRWDALGAASGGTAALSYSETQRLVRWLLMRQEDLVAQDADALLAGGLQGRPNKPGDTCYTFWIGASLKLLHCDHLLDPVALQQFVLSTQDPVRGGLGKTCGSGPDGLHSYLGLSGLALLGLQEGLREVDPALNITKRAVQYLKTLDMSSRH